MSVEDQHATQHTTQRAMNQCRWCLTPVNNPSTFTRGHHVLCHSNSGINIVSILNANNPANHTINHSHRGDGMDECDCGNELRCPRGIPRDQPAPSIMSDGSG
jgi:hypothetical protein